MLFVSLCLCVCLCLFVFLLPFLCFVFFFFDYSGSGSVTFCLLYDFCYLQVRLFNWFPNSRCFMLVFIFPKEEFITVNFQIWSSALFYAFHKCTFGYAIDVCSVLYVLCDKTKISHLSEIRSRWTVLTPNMVSSILFNCLEFRFFLNNRIAIVTAGCLLFCEWRLRG